MSHVLTLVASSESPAVSGSLLKRLKKILGFYSISVTGRPVWLAKGRAADLPLSEGGGSVLAAHLREELAPLKTDFFITPEKNRRKKLLLADMDSTIVTGETLDELAAFAGIKDKIAAITRQAMEGKLDFKAALKERVALLKDLPEDRLGETLEQTALSPGAETLVRTMRAQGAACVLVSGGFSFFTGAIAERAGFDHHHGNILETAAGKLTGTVREPILDRHAKLEFLNQYMNDLKLGSEDALTLGDGANDIPMLKKAGLGIGYRPKDAVLEAVPHAILYGDLTAALYAQGYAEKDFVKN